MEYCKVCGILLKYLGKALRGFIVEYYYTCPKCDKKHVIETCVYCNHSEMKVG